MERIHKINKLLVITYNLGGLCLMMIGGMVGIARPTPWYIPAGLKIATGIVFGTMIIGHVIRFIMEKKLKKTS